MMNHHTGCASFEGDFSQSKAVDVCQGMTVDMMIPLQNQSSEWSIMCVFVIFDVIVF